MRGQLSDLPIQFSGVSVRAGGVSMLQEVTATLSAGAPTALVGPNGAGKTTLIRVAMGLLAADAGLVTWGGRSDAPPDRRAMVFQKPVMLRRSVRANLAFALAPVPLAGAMRTARIARTLERTKLAALAERAARRLSGGEQQRLALARALVREPEVLFLDEPTNNLDPATTRVVEGIIRDAAESGIKVVMATHDLAQARRLCADVMFMVGGRLIEHAPAEQFFAAPTSPKAAQFLRGDIVE
ncbi:MAG: ATP-binding cassette domain-containing protein [Variibacter sp.]|nr:ATP-binding cassette domain-containing protein [Variibacter sp.]